MRFFCIGAQRCGTYWLYEVMKRHPHVVTPGYKEPHFFDREYAKGIDWYENRFEAVPGQPIGDFTATYLFHPLAIHLLHKHYPDAKIIVLLRDPVMRAYSHWALFRYGNPEHKTRLESCSFLEVVKDEARRTYRTNWEGCYVSRGFYAEQLYRVMYLFPAENIMVLRYEDLFDKKRRLVDMVCEFIGVAGEELPDAQLDVHVNRKSVAAEGPEPEAVEILKEIYAKPNDELCKLLGRDMGWLK